jgi:hypothetical protein
LKLRQGGIQQNWLGENDMKIPEMKRFITALLLSHGEINPDGTQQSILWGNNKADPAAVYYPRVISGSNQLTT